MAKTLVEFRVPREAIFIGDAYTKTEDYRLIPYGLGEREHRNDYRMSRISPD